MAFPEYVQIEFGIACEVAYKERKTNLNNCISYNGKIRTLETICSGIEFFSNINENLYCQIGSFNQRNVGCRYLCQEKDKNGNRTCNYAEIYTQEIILKLQNITKL